VGQRINDQREATGEVIARTAVEPHLRATLARAMMRKPSCLISCSHWPPEGNLSVFVGRHGAINPAGRVRCHMRAPIKLCAGYCNPNWARWFRPDDRGQLRRKPWPRRSTSWTSITSVAGAILINAPTLGGWYLLQGQAVAISRTTGIYALLFSGLSRRKGERGEIGVTRNECSRTQ